MVDVLMRVASLFMLPLSAGMVLAADGGDLPARIPSPLTVKQIHSGHSLSDAYGSHPWPGRFTLATARHTGDRAYKTIQRSIIPGAPLHWRWRNATDYPDARKNIDEFELLVTTEGVPLQPKPEWFKNDSLDGLTEWVRHAGERGNGGKGAETMLYSTWTYWRHSGPPPAYDTEHGVPFRERLERDGRRWELMQDTVNASRPKGVPLVYMIPGHRLMMRIYDDIQSGAAPGLTSIGDIFSDDIHLNDKGSYAITCLVYAVIYHRNPRDLPAVLAPGHDTLTPAQSDYFKKIAWDVATGYRRAGVPAN